MFHKTKNLWAFSAAILVATTYGDSFIDVHLLATVNAKQINLNLLAFQVHDSHTVLLFFNTVSEVLTAICGEMGRNSCFQWLPMALKTWLGDCRVQWDTLIRPAGLVSIAFGAGLINLTSWYNKSLLEVCKKRLRPVGLVNNIITSTVHSSSTNARHMSCCLINTMVITRCVS